MTDRLNACADGLCTIAEPRGAGRTVRNFVASLVAAVDSGISLLVDTLLIWERRRADRLRLQSLDDHMLRDIGISRADIEVEATKPFWRP